MDDLMAKIENYNKEIASLEQYIAGLSDDIFDRIAKAEASRTIVDYRDRVARLERRISGQHDGPTEQQVRLVEFVCSNAYDS